MVKVLIENLRDQQLYFFGYEAYFSGIFVVGIGNYKKRYRRGGSRRNLCCEFSGGSYNKQFVLSEYIIFTFSPLESRKFDGSG